MNKIMELIKSQTKLSDKFVTLGEALIEYNSKKPEKVIDFNVWEGLSVDGVSTTSLMGHIGWLLGGQDEEVIEDIGARKLRQCLFNNENSIAAWADCNPKLWGNENGALAAMSNLAYRPKAKDDDLTLDDVGSHFLAVASRIKADEHYANKQLCHFRGCKNIGVTSYRINGELMDGLYCSDHKPNYDMVHSTQKRRGSFYG